VRRTIPPGYFDICHTALREALKRAGDIAKRLGASQNNYTINTNDTNASMGTANLAFAHDLGIVATDRTPFGHWRSFLMTIFSAECKIAGDDVKLMFEIWTHAFEPYAASQSNHHCMHTNTLLPWRRFQEVSFFYLMCGGPGAGKSMRAKRMQSLLCNGWIQGSGSSSVRTNFVHNVQV
jgi:hypothetical protein